MSLVRGFYWFGMAMLASAAMALMICALAVSGIIAALAWQGVT